MSEGRLDFGLCEADLVAIKEARRRPANVDRDAAFRFIAQASEQVAAAVRRRPVPSGPPFQLPEHREDGSST